MGVSWQSLISLIYYKNFVILDTFPTTESALSAMITEFQNQGITPYSPTVKHPASTPGQDLLMHVQ